MIQKGDNVRFLNSVGGGIVSRIDAKKGLLYVVDGDGFEIPVLEKECVVVPAVSTTTNIPLKDFNSKANVKQSAAQEQVTRQEIEIIEEPLEIYETEEGEVFNSFLVFFPKDIKQLQTSSYECYLLNDSNYFVFYNFVIGENDARRSVVNGVIEPNMQEYLLDLEKPDLNAWEQLRIQLIPFKKEKEYIAQDAVDETIRINPVRFYKLHSFTENDYFDEPALFISLIPEKEKEEKPAIQLEPTAEAIKEAMLEKKEPQKKFQRKPDQRRKAAIIEIDLHSRELLDTLVGMSNADILQYQLDKFHTALDEYKNRRGQRIVFIHGKGEGVLRKEIENQLRNRYKSYYYQDASFREYGYGATLVMIR